MPTPESRTRAARLPAFERRARDGALLVALPAMLALVALLVFGRPDVRTAWLVTVAVVLATLALARWHQRRVIYPIHTLASLLEALRQGDYSLRGTQGSVLGDVIYDINALAERLQEERLQFEESSYLLGKTLAALDNAVLVFDEQIRLRLINPAAQQLLNAQRHQLFGRSASELGLQALLDAPPASCANTLLPDAAAASRYAMRRYAARAGAGSCW